MNPIETNGFGSLDNQEKEIANKLIAEYYSKIQRMIKNPLSLKLFFQEHEKGGKRKKYSIDAEAISSGRIFKSNAFDWDLARTIHKVLNKIMNEMEHHYHVSEQKS